MTTPPAVARTTAALYHGVVRHARIDPLRHSFSYRIYQWLVDLDDLPRPRWPLRLLARFDARDHFGDPASTIRANVDSFLARHDIDLACGSVVMLANARVFGYVFNPLSVYWCHHADGRLVCVIAEVHNTYGGRHCYVMTPDDSGSNPSEYVTDKAFYVSPFNAVEGSYRMRLPEPDERLALTINLDPGTGRPFVATLRGTRESATTGAVLRSAIRYPWATLVISARIRLHGIRLFLRGLPIVSRPTHHSQEGVQ